MYCEPYDASTLRVAFCHHVCYHFQSYRRLPRTVLGGLSVADLRDTLHPYGVRLLDMASDRTDLIFRVSLDSATSVAVAASKLKGRLCKWLNALGQDDSGHRLFARGYLGYTVGDPTTDAVMGYLDRQGLKHGYLSRPLPPVLVETPADVNARQAHLHAVNSRNCLRYHIVMGTTHRGGVFTEVEGMRILQTWQGAEKQLRFRVLKISVVPDHMHLAVRLHPAVGPVQLAVSLMNLAQDMMVAEFPETMIQYARDRLWQNGAYVGSFGDVNGQAIRRVLAEWRRHGSGSGAGAARDLLE